MFYTENANQDVKNQKRDITVPQALGIAGVIGALIGYQKLALIEAFYFKHYEEIYFIGVLLVVAVVALTVYQIKKRTLAFEKRAKTLRQVWDSSDGVYVGQTNDGVDIHVPENTRTGHTQIIGATGKGKTKSVIEAWASRDIMRGRNIILLDGKGDPDIAEHLKCVAESQGKDRCLFQVFDLGNPKSSTSVNPLENGSAQQITDRIFTAFEFQDPYYKSLQYDITGSVVKLIQEVDFYEYASGSEYRKFPGVITFKRLYEVLTNDNVLARAISDSKDPKLVEKLTSYLRQSKETRVKQLSGLLSQIGPFADGEISELVNGGGGEPPRFNRNISDLLIGERGRQMVLIILIPTLKYQQIGFQRNRSVGGGQAAGSW